MKIKHLNQAEGFTTSEIGPINGKAKRGDVIVPLLPTCHHPGPYLVCMESEDYPRGRSGCPNGSCHFFLVSLSTGERYNLDHFKGTRFAVADCELVINNV